MGEAAKVAGVAAGRGTEAGVDGGRSHPTGCATSRLSQSHHRRGWQIPGSDETIEIERSVTFAVAQTGRIGNAFPLPKPQSVKKAKDQLPW